MPRAPQLQQLFDDIADLPADAQARALAQARPSVRDGVRALLHADAQARERSRALRAHARGAWHKDATHNRGPEPLDAEANARAVHAVPPSLREQSAPGREHPPVTAGTRIEHYEIIRELGRGGMGAVYLARDTKLGRKVAIKFLDSRANANLVQRFVIEARATARCTHENIVVIHDVSSYQRRPYMVLEYLRGKPLAKVMATGRVAPVRAIELLIPVVRALICAHAADIVHRDLKPENIFLTDAGTIKVLDFGIAKLVRSTPPTSGSLHLPPHGIHGPQSTALPLQIPVGLTQQGALIGTMAYMSPEQWNGKGIDHRSDIWAVGMMLYIMVVGQHPLAPNYGRLLAITGQLDQPMPPVRSARTDLPAGLADIIDTCLRKPKQERFADAQQLLEALQELLPERSSVADLDSCESPYAGLTAFQESDASRFFGRSREIANLLSRVHDTPLSAVVGPSGVGKSSFVRAGLFPALKRSGDSWESIVVRPGRFPMAELANIIASFINDQSSSQPHHVADHQDALSRLYSEPGYFGTVLRQRAYKNDHKIILFIDKLEELYTLSPDPHERIAFTSCISGMADDPTSPLRVVVSIRSDFLDRAAEDHRFMSDLSRGLFFLTPPGRQGLRDAIVQPAEMLRHRFETPEMVEHMLDTLESTPGSLPLLQFTAAKLWESRDVRRRLLTDQSYRAMGGITGALASHADAVMFALPPATQALARTVLLRLVTPERTRAIASVAELCELWHDPSAVGALVSQLVEARLLVVQRGDSSTGPLVEIVHESMIHSWPTLRRWLDESHEDVAFLKQLRNAARQWRARRFAGGLLWRGEAQEEAWRWRRRYRGRTGHLEEAYLNAVFALAARTARRKRIAIVSVLLLLALVLATGAVALVLTRNAESEVREQLALVEQKERVRLDAIDHALATRKVANLDIDTIKHALLHELKRADGLTDQLRQSQEEMAMLAGFLQQCGRKPVDRKPRDTTVEGTNNDDTSESKSSVEDEQRARPVGQPERTRPGCKPLPGGNTVSKPVCDLLESNGE